MSFGKIQWTKAVFGRRFGTLFAMISDNYAIVQCHLLLVVEVVSVKNKVVCQEVLDSAINQVVCQGVLDSALNQMVCKGGLDSEMP